MKFHLSRPEGGQKGSHVDIWRKSDPGRGLGKCKGPEAANLASKNGILAESESARGEGGGNEGSQHQFVLHGKTSWEIGVRAERSGQTESFRGLW